MTIYGEGEKPMKFKLTSSMLIDARIRYPMYSKPIVVGTCPLSLYPFRGACQNRCEIDFQSQFLSFREGVALGGFCTRQVSGSLETRLA